MVVKEYKERRKQGKSSTGTTNTCTKDYSKHTNTHTREALSWSCEREEKDLVSENIIGRKTKLRQNEKVVFGCFLD